MSNIIAVIWDCDNTLIKDYMQDPIFDQAGIDRQKFWNQVEKEKEKIRQQGIRVNNDTYYLNYFIQCAHGKHPEFAGLRGLNKEQLREYGKKQKFYPGIPEIFEKTKHLFDKDESYADCDLKVEHYIISTGFAEVIRGSKLAEHVDGIWGCELLDLDEVDKNEESTVNNQKKESCPQNNVRDIKEILDNNEKEDASHKKMVMSEILYTVDHATKTLALFEINKGIGKITGIDVNSKIPKENRRVQFENMIYIADGPSDIPAFSVIKQKGGATFAVYPKGKKDAMRQVDQMREDGRVDMYAEADYSENTTAYMWIVDKICSMANKIRDREKAKIINSASDVPHHILS